MAEEIINELKADSKNLKFLSNETWKGIEVNRGFREKQIWTWILTSLLITFDFEKVTNCISVSFHKNLK